MSSTQKGKNNKNDPEEDSLDEILSWGSPISRASEGLDSSKNSPSNVTLDFLDDDSEFKINELSDDRKESKTSIPNENSSGISVNKIQNPKKKSIFDSSESNEKENELESFPVQNDFPNNNYVSSINESIDENEFETNQSSMIPSITRLQAQDTQNDYTQIDNVNDFTTNEQHLDSMDNENMPEYNNNEAIGFEETNQDNNTFSSFSENHEYTTNINNLENNELNNRDESNESIKENELAQEYNSFEKTEGFDEIIDENNQIAQSTEYQTIHKPNDDFKTSPNAEKNDNLWDNDDNSLFSSDDNNISLEDQSAHLNSEDNDSSKSYSNLDIDKEYSSDEPLNTKAFSDSNKSESHSKITSERSEEGKSVCSDFSLSNNTFDSLGTEGTMSPSSGISSRFKFEELKSKESTQFDSQLSLEPAISERQSFEDKIEVEDSSKAPNSSGLFSDSEDDSFEINFEKKNNEIDSEFNKTPKNNFDREFISKQSTMNETTANPNEKESVSMNQKSELDADGSIQSKIDSSLNEDAVMTRPYSTKETAQVKSINSFNKASDLVVKNILNRPKFKNKNFENSDQKTFDNNQEIAGNIENSSTSNNSHFTLNSKLNNSDLEKNNLNPQTTVIESTTTINQPKSKFSATPNKTSKFLNAVGIKFVGNTLAVCSRKSATRSQNGGYVDIKMNLVEFYVSKLPEISENSFKDKRVFEIIKLPLKNIVTDYPAIKSILHLKDSQIFNNDVAFTLSYHKLNEFCTNGESLIEKPLEILESVDSDLKNNKLQFEVLKMKLGLPYSFDNIEIPTDLLKQVALTGNSNLIKSFIKSQNNRIFFFIIFYKLGLVQFEIYRNLFENNFYHQFVLSKLGLIEYTQKSKSKWNLNNFINIGISKILNVTKTEQNITKTPLEIAFSNNKFLESVSSETKNEASTSSKLQIDSRDNENISLSSKDSNIPTKLDSNFSKTNGNSIRMPSFPGKKLEHSALTNGSQKNDIKTESEDNEIKAKDAFNLSSTSSIDKKTANEVSKPEDLTLHDNETSSELQTNSEVQNDLSNFAKLSIDSKGLNDISVKSELIDKSLNETKKVRTSSFFEDSDSGDIFGLVSSPPLQNTSESIGQQEITKPTPSVQAPVEPTSQKTEGTTKAFGKYNFPISKTSSLSSSFPQSSSGKFENLVKPSGFSFPVKKKEETVNAETHSEPLKSSDDSVLNTNSTLSSQDSASIYKKKLSKSFADIFSLESGDTQVSEAPDLSSCFAEVTETDKPILQAKEPSSSSFFSFFRRKPAVAQVQEDPLLNRATRPLKAELKVPVNKERKIIQSSYANMKETSNVDIPGANTTKK